jgi:CDP-diglyceride synthetase
MRGTFIIVAILGILLVVLGAWEFHAVNEENTRIATFVETSYEANFGHKVPTTWRLISNPNNTVELEIISMAIVLVGCVLAGIGWIGAMKSSKNLSQHL